MSSHGARNGPEMAAHSHFASEAGSRVAATPVEAPIERARNVNASWGVFFVEVPSSLDRRTPAAIIEMIRGGHRADGSPDRGHPHWATGYPRGPAQPFHGFHVHHIRHAYGSATRLIGIAARHGNGVSKYSGTWFNTRRQGQAPTSRPSPLDSMRRR